MKKLSLLIFLLITGITAVHSQTAKWVLGRNYIDHNYNPVSIRNTPLFDAAEVRARGIKTCYIIHHDRNWNNEIVKIDTVYIFSFDTNGKISRRINYTNHGWDRSGKDTIEGDFSEKRYYKRIDSSLSKQGDNLEINEYFIWAFNPENEIEDTGIIRRTVYDNKGRLLELKQNGTIDYHMIYFCGTGMTFYERYRYDDKNNIIFYQDIYSREYARFEHHPKRRVVRVYDSLSHEQKRKYTIHVDLNSQSIIEKDDEVTTFTRLSKDSKLFSLLSKRENEKGAVPNDYLLVYEYFDNPASKEKMLVKH